MAGYIGTKAVNLSTTGADIAGDADVSGALDVGGAITGVDAILSGGVYLGGTGSSNKLTDYEQGVWSPFWSDASGNAIFTASPTVNMADYTKIGNLVVASCYFNMPSSFSVTGSYVAVNDLHVGGLPFVANFDGNASYYDATVSWWNSWTGFTGSSVKGHTRSGSNRVVLFRPDGNGVTALDMSSVLNGSSAIILTVTYRTTS